MQIQAFFLPVCRLVKSPTKFVFASFWIFLAQFPKNCAQFHQNFLSFKKIFSVLVKFILWLDKFWWKPTKFCNFSLNIEIFHVFQVKFGWNSAKSSQKCTFYLQKINFLFEYKSSCHLKILYSWVSQFFLSFSQKICSQFRKFLAKKKPDLFSTKMYF